MTDFFFTKANSQTSVMLNLFQHLYSAMYCTLNGQMLKQVLHDDTLIINTEDN